MIKLIINRIKIPILVLLCMPLLCRGQDLRLRAKQLRYVHIENLIQRVDDLLSKANALTAHKLKVDRRNLQKSLALWNEQESLDLEQLDRSLEQAFKSARAKGMDIVELRKIYNLSRHAVLELEVYPETEQVKTTPRFTNEPEPVEDTTVKMREYRYRNYQKIHFEFISAILATTTFETIEHLQNLLTSVQKISTLSSRPAAQKVEKLIKKKRDSLKVEKILEASRLDLKPLSLGLTNLTNPLEEKLIKFLNKLIAIPEESLKFALKQHPNRHRDFLTYGTILERFSIPLSESTLKDSERIKKLAHLFLDSVANSGPESQINNFNLDRSIKDAIEISKGSVRQLAWNRIVEKGNKLFNTLYTASKAGRKQYSLEEKKLLLLCARNPICRSLVEKKEDTIEIKNKIENLLFGVASEVSETTSGQIDKIAFKTLRAALKQELSAPDSNNSNKDLRLFIERLKSLESAPLPNVSELLLDDKNWKIEKVNFPARNSDKGWPARSFMYQLLLKDKANLILPKEIVKKHFEAAITSIFPTENESDLSSNIGHTAIDFQEFTNSTINPLEIAGLWNFEHSRRIRETIGIKNFEKSEELIEESEMRLGMGMFFFSQTPTEKIEKEFKETLGTEKVLPERLISALELTQKLWAENKENKQTSLSPTAVELVLEKMGLSIEQAARDFFQSIQIIRQIEAVFLAAGGKKDEK